jgi:hypothetical protein
MAAKVSIGDFAVMTGLSRKVLRLYHDIGILEPARIDVHTGYRVYDTSQVDHAQVIGRFRRALRPNTVPRITWQRRRVRLRAAIRSSPGRCPGRGPACSRIRGSPHA